MSLIASLADAVVAELNGPSFTLAQPAVRRDLPRHDLASLKDLHVTVVPKGIEIQQLTRSGLKRDLMIDVAVQQRVRPEDLSVSDPLKALAEQIAGHFVGREVSGYPVIGVNHEPIYALEHLEQLSVFTSVVTLTIRVLSN